MGDLVISLTHRPSADTNWKTKQQTKKIIIIILMFGGSKRP